MRCLMLVISLAQLNSEIYFTFSCHSANYIFTSFIAEKYKDLVPDNAKNTDNATKNAEPLINLDGK